MATIPINNIPESKKRFRDECDAYDEDRWYNMVVSVRNRVMTRTVYKQLTQSLREISYHLSYLSSR